jgi:dipeptidyl aminopeptidase/acylaminoacyl peptidase
MKNYFPFLRLLVLVAFLHNVFETRAQAPTSYQTPPKALADLINAAPTPSVQLSPDKKWMLLLERPSLPSIEEVAEPELRLAGIRISPRTNGASRSSYYNGMRLKLLQGDNEMPVGGLPENPRMESVSWSSDGASIVFINTVSDGIELWGVDVASAKARKLTSAVVNNAMRGAYEWLDAKTLIYKQVIANRGTPPQKPAVPAGPTVQANEGSAAPVRTYQDLLSNRYDEALFEYYTSSELMVLDLATGNSRALGLSGIFSTVNASPDGNYILVEQVKKPFSYIVPYYRFPSSVTVYDRSGKLVRQVADLPVAENIPKGFNAVAEGPRSFTWRADVPATLYWVEAQDGGDPKREATVRDKMFFWAAPFSAQPQEGIAFSLRYGGVDWGTGSLAMAYENWWQNRREITRRWQPDNPAAAPEVLFDRSTEDSYNDPGSFVSTQNKYGRNVLMTADNGKTLYLTGQGASPEGNRPFVDKFELATKKSTRLWRSEAQFYERLVSMIDPAKGLLLTLREGNYVQPNFHLRNLNTNKLTQLTHFPNPFEAMKGVKKELVKYKRADGVEMTGTLYLPAGYDKNRDGTLPVLMWAYPREFKDASAAGQVTDSPNEFIRVFWGSPVMWVTQGYAVFDDVSMPVVGEGELEPNETFVQQLQANAKAAVDVVVDMGIADRNRIAIGGHSYGAFMTANLMAHTDLFAAGIARSGAYNRTLTPFGFQSEERTYWETPETYYNMSPFNFADKIKEPLLLIHGEADNNSGTFPMQSERMYAALKGHGATVRLVMLPHESHGYRAKESIMHMVWEMTGWMDKYVKNRQVEP